LRQGMQRRKNRRRPPFRRSGSALPEHKNVSGLNTFSGALVYNQSHSRVVLSRGSNKEKQMEKSTQNIQEAFLNNARKEKTFLTIYLMSGVKLSGRIKSFDKYSVILETNSQEQLIFKHAISTVVISKPSHGMAGAHFSTSHSPAPVNTASAAEAAEG
jgi:host factor-I protein